MNEMNNEFSIVAKTCTLKYNSQDTNDVILGNGVNYVIPIYQRPYSWTDEQLKKFISDIFISFWGNDGNTFPEPMFIGTMQLSAKNGNNQDIIDGQQRLTTFLIFIKVLKCKFRDNSKLNEISLNWLSTKVNNGKQQSYLEEMLSSDLPFTDETQNPYLRNAFFINECIDEQIKNEEEITVNFDIDRFLKHLFSNVYFVVIETRAGLSKTLQIFNAINTTGLDLNGGDIFKIRMYEYLRDKKQKDERAFEEISNLYSKIDQYNADLTYHATDITGILRIYQFILIARHGLPTSLYNYGTDTFFERLFDTIFNINQWEHFKNNVNSVDLSVEDLLRIIEVRYQWERNWKDKTHFNAESACSFHFIWWSRYSKYWELTFVLMYRFIENENCWSNMLEFNCQLSKLFFIYSIRFQKLKSDIYYGFMYQVIDAIVNKSYVDALDLINHKIGKQEDHNQGWYDLNWFLSENLTENAKRKNLICRLSAMLDEDYQTNDLELVRTIRNKIFTVPLDIEHIQSYHDSKGEKRQDIWDEWKGNINSIGNLIVLEQDINRSISNNDYLVKISSERNKSYRTSQFNIVKNQLENYPTEWNLDQCKVRKEKEVQKILNYLFN